MRKSFLLIPFLMMLLASCTSVSDIVPAGRDTFRVSGSNLAIGASGAAIKTALFKKASDSCITQGKVFEPIDSAAVDYRAFQGTANAELTFRCLAK